MIDRKKIILLVISFVVFSAHLVAQNVSFLVNGMGEDQLDVNKTELRTLSFNSFIPIDIIERADRIRIVVSIYKNSREIKDRQKVYTGIQLSSLKSKMSFNLLTREQGGYYSTDFNGVNYSKLAENLQNEIGLLVSVYAEEIIGETAEWNCSSYCDSHCDYDCSGGYSVKRFDYGNKLEVANSTYFSIIQRNDWEKRLMAKEKRQQELEATKIEDSKGLNAGRAILVGVSWGIAGLVIWDNFR